MKKLICINDEKTDGAMMCARMTFKGSDLTVSVNGRAKGSLLETICMFAEYFSDEFQDKGLHKLELFLNEGDMHTGGEAWQTTTFE